MVFLCLKGLGFQEFSFAEKLARTKDKFFGKVKTWERKILNWERKDGREGKNDSECVRRCLHSLFIMALDLPHPG